MNEAIRNPEDRESSAVADAIGSGLRVLRWIMFAAVVVYFITSCFFVVEQHEVALVLRFGRPSDDPARRALAPGLHAALPYPIDEIVRVPARRILTVETSAFWPDSGIDVAVSENRPGPAYTITGDANILHSRWGVRVAVSNPEQFAFAVRDVSAVLACELDRAIIQASAGFRVDDILRSDEAFRDAVAARIGKRIRELDIGVALERVDMLALSPPAKVKNAFDAVLRAEQEMSAAVNKALSDAGAVVTASQGQGARIHSRAMADVVRYLSKIEADASYFSRVQPEFEKAPGMLAAVLLNDAWGRAVRKAEGRYLLRSGKGPLREHELRILLSPEPAALISGNEQTRDNARK